MAVSIRVVPVGRAAADLAPPRNVDAIDVVGPALLGSVQGRSQRTIAARLGSPADTVRGWIRGVNGQPRGCASRAPSRAWPRSPGNDVAAMRSRCAVTSSSTRSRGTCRHQSILGAEPDRRAGVSGVAAGSSQPPDAPLYARRPAASRAISDRQVWRMPLFEQRLCFERQHGGSVDLRDYADAMAPPPEPDASYFDSWYAAMATSTIKEELKWRHLGLPPHLLSTSLLTWGGIAEVVDALRLGPDGTVLDLACGRGGYGLEIAGRLRCRLVGVDFSAEAIRQAVEHARRMGRTADFRVGELTATGLDDGSVTGVVCIDAIQFAEQPSAAYRELRRVLAPEGRAALTCWEAVDRHDERLPQRLRAVDLAAGLTTAGFVEIEVRDRPGWRVSERAVWEAAAAADPGGDPAMQSFHDEGVRVLKTFDLVRRVMATATSPALPPDLWG